ncbi:MAG: AbrB family transcriptional regulator [Burkholderiales bacterium]|nr:MAG: AbrB family transcriptional regulator [Burkholderiales bacterium]
MPPAAAVVVLRTLAIGAAGGFAFSLLGVPLAWMLGAMFATLGVSLAGLEVRVPARMRPPMSLVLGLTVGASFTPEMAAGVRSWWPSLLLVVPFVLIVGAAGALYFERVVGFDRRTAILAAVPGGLAEMVLLGDALGANVGRIATAQAARILITVAALPPAFALFGLVGDPSAVIATSMAAFDGAAALQFGALAVAGLAGWWLAARIGIPVPALMGPLAVSALAHALGWATVRTPFLLVACAQLVLGCSTGARFQTDNPRELLPVVANAAAYVLFALGVAALFGLAIARFGSADIASVVLAFAPAGANEMSLFALVLGLDAGFVATHQVARLTSVFALAPVFGRRLGRRIAIGDARRSRGADGD